MPVCRRESLDLSEALDRVRGAHMAWAEALHLCKFHNEKKSCENMDDLLEKYEDESENFDDKLMALIRCIMKEKTP